MHVQTDDKVTALCWAPNGRKLALCTADRYVILFDQTGLRRDKFTTKPAEKEGPRNYTVTQMSFSPQSDRLAIAQSDCIVFIYKLGVEWGEPKSISHKFQHNSSITALVWPIKSMTDFGYGLAEGRVKIGLTKSHKSLDLYRTESSVVAMTCNPEGNCVVCAHMDGSVYTFNIDTPDLGAHRICCYNSVPSVLAWGTSIVIAGNNGKIAFYSKDGEEQQVITMANNNEFGACVSNPSGDKVILSINKTLYTFTCNDLSKQWENKSNVETVHSTTVMSWIPDGNKLAVGTSMGILDLYVLTSADLLVIVPLPEQPTIMDQIIKSATILSPDKKDFDTSRELEPFMANEPLAQLIAVAKGKIEALISKPKMTEKLLSRPPFRFLHDLITMLIKQTGFGKGLYSKEELDSSAYEDNTRAKLAYLDKIILLVSKCKGEPLEVKSSRVAQGLEPEFTNKFLIALAEVASNPDIDRTEMVRQIVGNIHKAIESLNAVDLQRIAERTVDMEKVENGNTPLLNAAERGFYEGVEILLRYKANAFAVQHNTLFTIVHLAVVSGDIPTLQLVLESNESLTNIQDLVGNTPLHLAIQLQKEDCVKTLLFFYPDLSIKNLENETPIYSAARLHAWSLFHLLCNHEEEKRMNLKLHILRSGDSLLVMAYRDRDAEAISWLLEHGADWNDVDSLSGKTVFELVFQELCDYDLIGSCVNSVPPDASTFPHTVMHLSPFFEKFQHTPWMFVHFGATKGNKIMLETVLEVSSNDNLINIQDVQDGNTAMHMAVKANHVQCVRTLLFFYPDLAITNKEGETSTYYAAKHHNWESIHILLQQDTVVVNVNHHPTTGDSLLVLAVRDRQVEIVRLLIEKGANVNLIDKQSGLPMWFHICLELQQMGLTEFVLTDSSGNISINFEDEMRRNSDLFNVMIMHVQDITTLIKRYVQQMNDCDNLLSLLQKPSIINHEKTVEVICNRLRILVETVPTEGWESIKCGNHRQLLANTLKVYDRNDEIWGNIGRILFLLFPLTADD